MRRAVLMVVLLAGCGIAEPVTPTRIEPPEYFVGWMAATLECSGSDRAEAAGRVRAIEWYTTTEFVGGDPAQMVHGRWYPSPRRIYLRADETGVRRTVVHEMEHDILNGDPDHSDQRWARCT